MGEGGDKLRRKLLGLLVFALLCTLISQSMALLPTWTKNPENGYWEYNAKEHYRTEATAPGVFTALSYYTTMNKKAWQWSIAYDIDQSVQFPGRVWHFITMSAWVDDVSGENKWVCFKLEVYNENSLFLDNWDYHWTYKMGNSAWKAVGGILEHDEEGFVVMSFRRDLGNDKLWLTANLYENDDGDYGDLVYNCDKALTCEWNDIIVWTWGVEMENAIRWAWIEGDYGTRSAGSLTSEEVSWNPLGDANGDGTVGIADMGIVSAAWNSFRSVVDTDWDERADVNSDGTVNILDQALISAHWGETE